MKAYLIFEDSSIFLGESIGKRGEAIGEAVFTTAMTGYVETLTDPNYFGQIITHTFPMIGNYGVTLSDAQSNKVHASGYIVRELCPRGSNFRKDCELDEFLKKQGVVGIAGLDTREITKKIRDSGRLNVMISDNKANLDKKLSQIKAYKIQNAVSSTSVTKVSRAGSGKRVVLWDFGAKESIQQELLNLGCTVIRVPHNYTAKQILELSPQGILLSNGGGNPAENKSIIQEIKILMSKKIPMFGICLGHQLICLAAGARTKRLKCGHRGSRSVRDTISGRVYIASQNHGYVVHALPKNATIRFTNLNDKTCEGVDFSDLPIFTAQFYPSGNATQDTKFLFRRFITLMDEVNIDA